MKKSGWVIAIAGSSLCALVACGDEGAPLAGATGTTVPQTNGDGVETITWTTTATHLSVGQRVTYYCPSGGTASSVYGTDVYTADSSICTAAVHFGLIGFVAGGAVTIDVVAGRSSYAGSIRNGVTSNSWGSFSLSFQFLGFIPPPGQPCGVTIDWNANAAQLPIGQRVTYACVPGGAFGPVWGTDVYTADSSICTAAVHAGVNTQQGGIPFTIEVVAGQSAYAGSTRNGVTSGNWPAFGKSFRFVANPAPTVATSAAR